MIDAFQTWIIAERGLSPLTAERYGIILRYFMAFLLKHRGEEVTLALLLAVSLSDLRAFLAQRMAAGIQKQTNALTISALKTFYRFLKQSGHDVTVPFYALKRPRLPRLVPRPLTQDQAQTLSAAIPDAWFYLALAPAAADGGVVRVGGIAWILNRSDCTGRVLGYWLSCLLALECYADGSSKRHVSTHCNRNCRATYAGASRSAVPADISDLRI